MNEAWDPTRESKGLSVPNMHVWALCCKEASEHFDREFCADSFTGGMQYTKHTTHVHAYIRACMHSSHVSCLARHDGIGKSWGLLNCCLTKRTSENNANNARRLREVNIILVFSLRWVKFRGSTNTLASLLPSSKSTPKLLLFFLYK